MDRFERAATLFEDRVEEDGYFGFRGAESARGVIESLLSNRERPLIFLLGEPGSGKTRLLKILAATLPGRGVRPLLFDDPFTDRRALLTRLAVEAGLSIDGEDDLKERLVSRFRAVPHLIMFDEAQLLGREVLESIRMLNDTGAFRFLLAMHREEGEAILRKPHFNSRSHRVAELGRLERDETLRYIRERLQKGGMDDLAAMFDKKEVARLHRYSRGNFRMTKRMLYALFELMAEAARLGKERFTRPNATLWCMAAIRTGADRGGV